MTLNNEVMYWNTGTVPCAIVVVPQVEEAFEH